MKAMKRLYVVVMKGEKNEKSIKGGTMEQLQEFFREKINELVESGMTEVEAYNELENIITQIFNETCIEYEMEE